MPEIALSEASKEQLLEYAKSAMNLENVDGRSSAETLRALIKQNGGPDEIPGEKTSVLPVMNDGRNYGIDFRKDKDGNPRKVGKEERDDDKKAGYSSVTLVIAQQEGEHSLVPVSCNGVTITIPRGEVCTIPRCYYEILNNAKYYRFSAMEDAHGSSALGKRMETPRFPVSVHHQNP